MVPFRNNSRRARRSQEQNDDTPSSAQQWHDSNDRYIMTFPIHPLPSMQAPFEESMLDATGETGYVPYTNPDKNPDTRQQQLCKEGEAPELKWNFTYNCHWRNNSKGQYHPLLKTVAQIIFGVHLLHQHLEKSVADVAEILLKHVNELDGFLQRANEDVEGSLKDMLFRRRCLQVPMEHVNEFDRLLEDRTYRAQLLDGNVTIERTINRMSVLLNDYLIDMGTFREATQDLEAYLLHVGGGWSESNEDVGRIYTAMCGNTSGWLQYVQSLVAKTERLGVVLVQVSSYCNEIEKRCGAASRRSLIASRSSSRSTNSRDAARSFRNFEHNKPLPSVPNERPPFMTPSFTNAESSIEDASSLHAPSWNASSLRKTSNASEMSTESEASAEEAYEEDAIIKVHAEVEPSPVLPSAGTSDSDVTVLPMSRYDHVPSESNQSNGTVSQGLATHVREDSHGSLAGSVESPRHAPNDSNKPAPRRIIVRNPRGDSSPPLTGKDSAYSSVSGGSFASPSATHSRSASSQAFPRHQFGLFPSSTPGTPGTPVGSFSGQHGAVSPALSASQMSRMSSSVAYQLPSRSQSALGTYDAPTSKLAKRSSFASLKKLFSKKKHGVDTIEE